MAILINEGTNIAQGQISFVTQSTSAVLQLAVSMDYAVFLLHRFVSAKNTKVGSVQFVMMTKEIKTESEQAAAQQQPAEQTFWQKLLALIGYEAD